MAPLCPIQIPTITILVLCGYYQVKLGLLACKLRDS